MRYAALRWLCLVVAVVLGLSGAVRAQSRPAAPQYTLESIAKLVRDLNSPSPRAREAAAAMLQRAPLEALPDLKRAVENAPFEVRAQLEPIIKGLEQSSGGVILVSHQGYGWNAPMPGGEDHPGDVFYRLDDAPIRTVQDWDAFWKNAPFGEHVIHARSITGPPQRTWMVDPYSRWPHLLVMDYEERYGSPLRKALAEAWDRHYEQADAAFAEAVQAGAPVGDSIPAGAVRALTRYYTGRPEEAHQLFRELVDKHAAVCTEDPWLCVRYGVSRALELSPGGGWGCFEFSGSSVAADGHFGLYIRREALAHRPQVQQLQVSTAYYLAARLCRFPEAIAMWGQALNTPGPEADLAAFQATARGELFWIFQALKMKSEVLDLARQAVEDRGLSPAYFSSISAAAAKAGDLNLAERCLKRHAYWEYQPTEHTPDLASMEWFCLFHGRLEEARKIVREMPPADAILSGPRDGVQGWSWVSLASEWADLARRAVAEKPNDEVTLSNAFIVLARQSDIDVKELAALSGRMDEQFSAHVGGKPQPDPFRQTILALHRGEFAEAHRLLQAGWDTENVVNPADATRRMVQEHRIPSAEELERLQRRNWAAQTAPHAVDSLKFLSEHGAALTGQAAVWSRTWEVYPLGAAGWVLITRDGRIGWAAPDLKRIDELPVPGPFWHPSADRGRPWTGKKFVVASPSGRTIAIRRGTSSTVVVGDDGGDLCSLRSGDHAWTRLIDARSSRWPNVPVELGDLPDILDQLHDEVVRRGKPLEITSWRLTFPGRKRQLDGLAVLADGNCIHFRGPGGTHPDGPLVPLLVDLNELLLNQTGKPTVIYCTQLESYPRERLCFHYLFTDQGLFKYDLDTSALTRVPVPGQTAPTPVVLLVDGENRPEFLRFGLLPADGGVTYRLDVKTGAIKPEGCINETIPLLYWAGRTEEQNRTAVMEELRKAGQQWPLKLSAQTKPMD